MSYTNNPSIGAVTSAGNKMMGFGNEIRSMFSSSFPGTYQQLITQSRVDPSQQASIAGSQVTKQFEASRGQMMRTLQRMGVNPNSARFASTMRDWARTEAAAKSGAMTLARWNAGDTAFSRTQAVAGLGLNLAQLASGNYQGAANAYGTAGALRFNQNKLNFDVDQNIQQGQGYEDNVNKQSGGPR